MVSTPQKIWIKSIETFPLLILFFISLNGNSTINISFISINIHYIIVYYWVLRKPESLGYGFIFLSGVISDVVLGFPIGVTSLSLLFIAGAATYIRVVTVRATLLNDWMSFIPALLIANFTNFVSLHYSSYPLEYIYLLKSSVFTFIFYPILWMLFSIIYNLIKKS